MKEIGQGIHKTALPDSSTPLVSRKGAAMVRRLEFSGYYREDIEVRRLIVNEIQYSKANSHDLPTYINEIIGAINDPDILTAGAWAENGVINGLAVGQVVGGDTLVVTDLIVAKDIHGRAARAKALINQLVKESSNKIDKVVAISTQEDNNFYNELFGQMPFSFDDRNGNRTYMFVGELEKMLVES